MKKSESTCR